MALCPQRPEFLKLMKKKHNLTFNILRDEENTYAHTLGLRFTLPEYLKQVYLSFPLDLARVNGDESWTLPMPARYVVSKEGRIVAADFDPDYTRRPEPDKILADLSTINI